VCTMSPTRIWAVGTGGAILGSTDGGVTWAPEASGTTTDLRAVSCAGMTALWVAGDAGTLLVSVP
jgi:photosystem II stability/assembly factor-like uncharacterized protein